MEFLHKIWLLFLDTFQTLIIAASIFLAIYVFFFRPFQVNGDSMNPNFVNGEYVLTNLITLYLENPKQGDVVVFKSPTNKEKDFIKRIIAEPGDSLSVKNGMVYVNGQRLNEGAYLKNTVKTNGGRFLSEGREITVDPGAYFVMGDNRLFSSDSREWGFVKKEDLIGKSWFVYWPPNSARTFKNPFSP